MLSEISSNCLWRSDVLPSSEFKNITSILFYTFIEFIMFLYAFLVISFFQYKEYIIYLILFSNFSKVLSAFTCASAIGNLWSICWRIKILRFEWSETLSEKPVPSIFTGNIPLSKASSTRSLPSKIAYKLLRISFFSCFLSEFSGLVVFLKFIISTNEILWSSSAYFK